MRKIIFLILVLQSYQGVDAQVSISNNNHYILKNGKPFFWMGDIAWELFAKLTKEESDAYLKTRSEQGFTVMQAVVK